MFFVVGFLVGFMGSLVGVDGGVFLAVELIVVDVNLARIGRLSRRYVSSSIG
jgi:uncharacterized membrane protein YfcA